jgi:hypothetical protein
LVATVLVGVVVGDSSGSDDWVRLPHAALVSTLVTNVSSRALHVDLGIDRESRYRRITGLIEISGDTFLCTAKHVIDDNTKSTLYVDGPSKMEVLKGDFYVMAEVDVAVLKLTPDQIETL